MPQANNLTSLDEMKDYLDQEGMGYTNTWVLYDGRLHDAVQIDTDAADEDGANDTENSAGYNLYIDHNGSLAFSSISREQPVDREIPMKLIGNFYEHVDASGAVDNNEQDSAARPSDTGGGRVDRSDSDQRGQDEPHGHRTPSGIENTRSWGIVEQLRGEGVDVDKMRWGDLRAITDGIKEDGRAFERVADGADHGFSADQLAYIAIPDTKALQGERYGVSYNPEYESVSSWFVKESVVSMPDHRTVDVTTKIDPKEGKYDVEVHPVLDDGLICYGIDMRSTHCGSSVEAFHQSDRTEFAFSSGRLDAVNDINDVFDKTWIKRSEIYRGDPKYIETGQAYYEYDSWDTAPAIDANPDLPNDWRKENDASKDDLGDRTTDPIEAVPRDKDPVDQPDGNNVSADEETSAADDNGPDVESGHKDAPDGEAATGDEVETLADNETDPEDKESPDANNAASDNIESVQKDGEDSKAVEVTGEDSEPSDNTAAEEQPQDENLSGAVENPETSENVEEIEFTNTNEDKQDDGTVENADPVEDEFKPDDEVAKEGLTESESFGYTIGEVFEDFSFPSEDNTDADSEDETSSEEDGTVPEEDMTEQGSAYEDALNELEEDEGNDLDEEFTNGMDEEIDLADPGAEYNEAESDKVDNSEDNEAESDTVGQLLGNELPSMS